ncbi:MAG: hypothetical protein NVSMB55_03840 [Mycobacteriales bacterium]
MSASRRQFLTGATTAAALSVGGGVQAFPERQADVAAGPLRPQGTTLDSTVRRGPPVNQDPSILVLDTVHPNGEADGSIDQGQLDWLKARLQEVSGPGRNTLVVVLSHHTVATMTNPLVSVDAPGRRVLGTTVPDLLLTFAYVVLWVNGHTHVNRVRPYLRAGGGRLWELRTAAHIDYPTQARTVEIIDNVDGTLSIVAAVLVAAAPLAYGGRLDSALSLAFLTRELAANDWQERPDAHRGKVEDRNVELLVGAPFVLSPARPPVAAPRPTAPRQLPRTGAHEGVAVVGAAALAAAVALRWSRRVE